MEQNESIIITVSALSAPRSSSRAAEGEQSTELMQQHQGKGSPAPQSKVPSRQTLSAPTPQSQRKV